MSNSLSKYFRCLTLVLVTLILSSCSKKPSKAIIGKWYVEGQSALVEFRKDSTLTSTENGHAVPGTYKFTDDTHMQLEIDENGSNKVNLACEIAVRGDKADFTLMIPAPDGLHSNKQTVHLKRVK